MTTTKAQTSLTSLILRCLASMVIVASAGCTDDKDKPEWDAYVYPDPNAMPDAASAHRFVVEKGMTFERCQAIAVATVLENEQKTGIRGDYECGFRCSPRSELGGIVVCQKDAR